MNIQDWFPLGWTGLISLQSKGLSRVFSSTTAQKHQFFGIAPSVWFNSYLLKFSKAYMYVEESAHGGSEEILTLLWADSRGRGRASLGSEQRDHLEKGCSPGLFRIQLLSSMVLLRVTMCYYAAGWDGSLGSIYHHVKTGGNRWVCRLMTTHAGAKM